MVDAHIKCSYQMTFEYVQVSKKRTKYLYSWIFMTSKKGDGPNI